MSVDRRELIQILGAGLATAPAIAAQNAAQNGAQHQHGTPARVPAVAYAPRALTAAQFKVVETLVDILLPADEASPGAREAGVARYIDIVLLYGTKPNLETWNAGISAVEAAADTAHGRAFTLLALKDQTDILRTMARNELHPETELERFFVALKTLAIEAYYLSEAGKQSLGYKGDTAIANFPGCTHSRQHQSRTA